MTRALVSRYLLVALVWQIPAAARAQQPKVVNARAGSVETRLAPQTATIAYDRDLTDSARVLAGMLPERPEFLPEVVAQPAWQTWHRELDTDWGRAAGDRFTKMRAWAGTELTAVSGSCGTLMYPFSGPDILNAYLLFPTCDSYVMFGLERLGSIPELAKLPPDRLERLFADTRQALGDLLTRNYFITSKMMSQFETQELHGLLPIFSIFLARLDAKIVSVRQLDLAADGSLRERVPGKTDPLAAPALEIAFCVGGGKVQKLLYFRAQAEDPALKKRPGVIPFLQRLAPFVTFLKSASYLMHDPQFQSVRSVLLQHSTAILQDDSGIPYKFMAAPAWHVDFYGQYQKPIKDFNYGYQPDLAAAYAVPGAVKPLAFSFGYHWATGSSTLMLAVRNPPVPPATVR